MLRQLTSILKGKITLYGREPLKIRIFFDVNYMKIKNHKSLIQTVNKL